MGVDRIDNGTDDSAEKAEKPPAKDTQWRPPPDRPGSPGQPSRLESYKAAAAAREAETEQRDGRDDRRPSPAEEKPVDASREKPDEAEKEPGDRESPSSENESDDEVRDDRSQAAPVEDVGGQPGKDRPAAQAGESVREVDDPTAEDQPDSERPGKVAETDDVGPGGRADPVRPGRENEAVPEDDVKPPAEVQFGESAEQGDEQRTVRPEQVQDETDDSLATGTQLEAEDKPAASLVADRVEKPEYEATSEQDGREGEGTDATKAQEEPPEDVVAADTQENAAEKGTPESDSEAAGLDEPREADQQDPGQFQGRLSEVIRPCCPV